jgi:hypothetical protein
MDFNQFQPSTKTIIALSNFNIDLNNFYDTVPVVPFIILPKKRGRKKRGENIDPNIGIPEGSIISIRNTKFVKGVIKTPKKKKINSYGKKKDWFLNSISIYIALSSTKTINVKISKHGKFHMTGCKTIEHAIKIIYYLFHYMKESERLYNVNILSMKKFKSDDDKNVYEFDEVIPEIIFNTVMNNIDFKIPYKINRDKVDEYLTMKMESGNGEFLSLFEDGENTGINIKIKPKLSHDIYMERIKFFPYNNTALPISLSSKSILSFFSQDKQTYSYTLDKVHYTKYIEMLPEKEQIIWKNNCSKKYHTFLVFHSGAIILSGASMDMMKIDYNKFINLMMSNRHIFEEKLINS